MSESPHPLPPAPLYLWDEQPPVQPDREHIKDQRIVMVDNPSITPFWPEPTVSQGAAVIIFPGGGYRTLAINHEGYDIARWFAQRGIAAFVVKYRLQQYGFPAALLDGLRAVRKVRMQAREWNLRPDKIGVVGFSAGGHVAAGVATRSRFALDGAEDMLGAISARPDFAVLGYPVITMEGEGVHNGSRVALLGEHPNLQAIRENSLQFQVTADIPPTFIFHGAGDQAVPVTNSLSLFTEIQRYDKQSELHIYQSHIHGVGMIQGQGSISTWPLALEAWLQQFMAG